DGIEVGGFAGGIDAEEDADGGGDDEAGKDAPHGDGRGEVDQQGDGLGEHDAEDDTDGSAGESHGCGLHEELLEQVGAPGAEGFADPDLAGALGDGDQHDVHDDDAADDQRDGGDGDRNRSEVAGDGGEQAGQRVRGLDGE